MIAILAIAALAAPQNWGALTAIDLSNPLIKTRADLEAFHLAASLVLSHGALPPDAPPSVAEWVRSQRAKIDSATAWFIAARFSLHGPLATSGLSGQALDLAQSLFGRVCSALSSLSVPTPRYAIFIRAIDGLDQLPQPLLRRLHDHRRASQVVALTLMPRFVIIPRKVPLRPWPLPPTVLFDETGRIKDRLTLTDTLAHELVHAVLGAVRAEAAGPSGQPRYGPQWFEEGIAVYVTEKLKLEPGTKPASYYRFSAPFHFIEREFGPEALAEFVGVAVRDGLRPALGRLGMSESELLEKARQAALAPKPPSVLARNLGYVVLFLLLLLLVAAAPLALAAAFGLLRRLLFPLDARALMRLYEQARSAPPGPARQKAIRRFTQAFISATDDARHEFLRLLRQRRSTASSPRSPASPGPSD